MKMLTNPGQKTRLCLLAAALLFGALALGSHLHAGFEEGEPLAMLLATDYAQAAEAANPNGCPANQRCVEWCDFTNGAIHPSGTLCCVPASEVGRQVDISYNCRRPAGS